MRRAVATTVVFDVLGTLFSLERLRAPLRALGAPDAALQLWFAQSLRDYFAFSHAGGYVPLAQVLEASLPRSLALFGANVGDAEAGQVVAAMRELDPADGAHEACSRLRDAGCSLVALSNGSLETATALLERAGLAGDFAAIRSCDEISVSKPAAAAYALAGEGNAWLVAAHAWDVAGAMRAGLRGAWVSTVEATYLRAYPPPDVSAARLDEAARLLLAA